MTITPNEIREQMGFDPRPELDKIFVPNTATGLVEVGEENKSKKRQSKQKGTSILDEQFDTMVIEAG